MTWKRNDSIVPSRLRRKLGIVDAIAAVCVTVEEIVDPVLNVFDGSPGALARANAHVSATCLWVKIFDPKLPPAHCWNDLQVRRRYLESAGNDEVHHIIEAGVCITCKATDVPSSNSAIAPTVSIGCAPDRDHFTLRRTTTSAFAKSSSTGPNLNS